MVNIPMTTALAMLRPLEFLFFCIGVDSAFIPGMSRVQQKNAYTLPLRFIDFNLLDSRL